jgi:hypothetical protein
VSDQHSSRVADPISIFGISFLFSIKQKSSQLPSGATKRFKFQTNLKYIKKMSQNHWAIGINHETPLQGSTNLYNFSTKFMKIKFLKELRILSNENY